MMTSFFAFIKERRQKNPYLDVVLWGITLAVGCVVGKYTDFIKDWYFNFLPTSIMALDANWWRAFAFTVSASLLAWFFALFFGYIIGLISAVARLSTGPELKIHQLIGTSIHSLYRILYLIPFVLTATITYNLAYSGEQSGYLPRWGTGLIMIAVAGIALGGYRVFMALYGAVADAKLDSIALSRSLFCGATLFLPRRLPFYQKLRLVLRLRDCEITLFSRSLDEAFHLSIVAIMILEAVLSVIYEKFFPSTRGAQDYVGGVGHMIVIAQQSLNPRQIFGILWLILIFDGIVAALIRWITVRVWHRHYQRRDKEVA
ncbi:MAG: hypothetical protein HY867_13640 [Chloroflexi bacterium]|nr:hypothetical protein [Chloroflexota bacterium]